VFHTESSRTNSTFGFSQRQKSYAKKTKRAVFLPTPNSIIVEKIVKKISGLLPKKSYILRIFEK